MLFHKYVQNPSLLMRVGLFSLILGALSLRFLQRLPGMTESRADFVTGLLYGIAIASLLLSIRARAAARRSGNGDKPNA